jgi:hypothetical protein
LLIAIGAFRAVLAKVERERRDRATLAHVPAPGDALGRPFNASLSIFKPLAYGLNFK